MSICGNPTDYVVLAPLVLPPPAPVWDFWAFRLFFQGFSAILLAGPRPVLALLALPPPAPVWDFRAFRLFFQGFFNYSARRSQTSSRAARPAAFGSCLGLLGVPPIKIQPVRSGQINLPLTFWLYFCVQNCLISFLRAELFIWDFYLKYSTPDSNTFRSCSPQILMATDWPWRSM